MSDIRATLNIASISIISQMTMVICCQYWMVGFAVATEVVLSMECYPKILQLGESAGRFGERMFFMYK